MVKGLISKIQHYSTKDGPGIRTTVFMMGCNLRCLWCANPENLEHKKQVFYFKERCMHCGLCVKYANHQSITFDKVGCRINRDLCDNLMDMVDVCPYDAYELVGKEYEVDELVQLLLRDKEYYEASQGGVTFSGGEAALQSEFLIEVCKKLKEHHVHVCLDTAGHIPTTKLLELVEYVDMVLYDIKAMDEQMHLKCTGVSNSLIKQNLERLSHIPMIVRMVVVPGYNDDIDDVKARLDWISKQANILQVDVLKYHIFGVGKYDKLQMEYPIKETIVCDDVYFETIKEYGVSKGLKMTIGG